MTIAITTSGSTATVTFAAPLNDGGSPVISYIVALSNGRTLEVPGLVASFVGLPAGTITANVSARNAFGVGNPSVNSAPAVVTPPPFLSGVLIALPTIIGTATTYTTPDTVTGQQWSLDGVDVAGATLPTYTQAIADSAKALRVREIVGANSTTSLPALPGVQNLKLSNTVALRAMLAGGVRGMIIGSGDSAMSGFTSGGAASEVNMRPNSYLAQAAAKLTAAGFPASKDSGFGSGQATTNANYQAMDPRWVFSSGVSILASYPTLGGLMFGLLHTNTTDSAVFTPGTAFDTVDVYFGGNTSAGGSFAVYGNDGVTQVGTVATGALTGIGVTTITMPAGTTSVTLKYLSGSGAGDPYCAGIKTRLAATPKIELIDGALTGTQVAQNAVAPGTGAASVTSYVPRAVTAKLYDPAIKTVLAVNGWYNDQAASMTLAQIKASYDIICLEAQSRGWDIWYIGYPALSTGIISLATFNAFEPQVMAYLRDTYNAVIIQESKIFTDYTTYNALGYYGDQLHINGTGHSKIADTITAICKLAASGNLAP